MKKKRIIAVIAAVLVIAAAVAAVILLGGNGAKYKVKLGETPEKLTVTVSGNSTGLLWSVENASESVVAVKEISNGKTSVFEITPKDETVSFFDVLFTLGKKEYIIFVKGMVDENGAITETSSGYFDYGRISVPYGQDGEITASSVENGAVRISFPAESSGNFVWNHEDTEGLSFMISDFGADGTSICVSAEEAGKHTAVFFNAEAKKKVTLSFSRDDGANYTAKKITVADYEA